MTAQVLDNDTLSAIIRLLRRKSAEETLGYEKCLVLKLMPLCFDSACCCRERIVMSHLPTRCSKSSIIAEGLERCGMLTKFPESSNKVAKNGQLDLLSLQIPRHSKLCSLERLYHSPSSSYFAPTGYSPMVASKEASEVLPISDSCWTHVSPSRRRRLRSYAGHSWLDYWLL